MAPKRKVAALEDVVPSSYSPLFPFYNKADLVVKSSDGVHFATQALYLRSTSSVFDDILSLPPPENPEKKDGLPLIKIEETGELFEIFLRYIHPAKLLVDNQPPAPSWASILLLSKLFDKYDSGLLARFVLLEQLPRFLRDPLVAESAREKTTVAGSEVIIPPSVEVFAIASIHRLEDLAKRCLRWSHVWGLGTKGTRTLSHKDSSDQTKMTTDWRPSGLGDLPDHLGRRIPWEVAKTFSNLHQKVLTTPGYSWLKAGDDFKL